jgi:hypothetical protein
MSENKEFDPFEQMTFSADKCFVCGADLNDDNSSVEHVYPKWLQNGFDLWNSELVLLNGSKLKYRNITVPCCKSCNNEMSSNIEKPMKEALKGGYDSFIELDKKIIFQWLNKISYGILFRQLSLRSEIRDPHSQPIYSEDNLAKHKMQHLFLRSTVSKAEYVHNPWSILIFRIHEDDNEKYWAFDSPFIKTFFMHANDVGIVAHLMDNGCNEEFYMQFEHKVDLLKRELHPLQFRELCAQFQYKSGLFNRNPFYTNIFDKEKGIDTIVAHDIGGDIYDCWNQQHYARVLQSFLQEWKMSFDDIYFGDDKVITYLKNEDGTFKDIYDEISKMKQNDI